MSDLEMHLYNEDTHEKHAYLILNLAWSKMVS